MAGPRDTEAIAATERWFIARGLPHFIFRYSASRDVWTRAAPLLTLIVLIEVLANAPSADFEIWVSVLVSVAAFLAVIAVWAVSNRLRQRPTFARPEDVGGVEVTLFIVLPALVPVVTDGQWRSGLVTAGVNLGILLVIYFGTSYGIVPMSRWVIGHGARQILSVSGVLVRALPLLLLVVIVVFFTTEPFQLAHEVPTELIGATIAFFLLLATAFAVIQVPRVVAELSEAESWAEIKARAADTPATPLCARLAKPSKLPGLSNREWVNIGLVVLASEAMLVLLVGTAMFGFLVALGVLAVPTALADVWIGEQPDVLLSFEMFGSEHSITTELLEAAAFLAGFSALQFTVSLLSDKTYQDEFLYDLRDKLREALAVRAVYLTVMIKRAR